MGKVVCINADGVKLTKGKEYEVTSDDPSDPHMMLVGDDGREFGYYRYRFKPAPEGPVRTVTRREVVPGVYGVILVNQAPSSTGDKVDVTFKHIDGHTWYDANELRSAAMVLSQLAEFLDEDKGDE